MRPLEVTKLKAGNPVRELWATAAISERFQIRDLLSQWLKKHPNVAQGVQQEAMFASRDIQNLAESGLNADGSETQRLSTDARVAILKQLGAKVARRALDELSKTDLSPVERMLKRLMDGERLQVVGESRQNLLALRIAMRTARAIGISPQFTEEELDKLIQRQDFMMTLGGPDLHRFVGRTDDLAKIHRLWEMDAGGIVIAGPGGMGKSLLISRFIADLMDQSSGKKSLLSRRFSGYPDTPTAVFHFDYDRYDLQAIDGRGGTSLERLTSELLQQARRWLPVDEIDDLMSFGVDYLGGNLESFSYSRSSRRGLIKGDVAYRLGQIFNRKSKHKACVVFVFDSLEQILGHDDEAIYSMDLVTDRIRAAGVKTFAIYASRSIPENEQIFFSADGNRVDLSQFNCDEARLYLINEANRVNIELSDKLLKQVIATVGRSPLALRLAVSLMEKDQKAFDPKQWAKRLRNDPERIQASLYDRVLKRIRDPNLAKIARPGLLVRRLTKDVIEYVLAGPCNLSLKNGEAETLLSKGRIEGQLFTVNPIDADPSALWHRADVRALMLPDLDTEVSDIVAQDINIRAINYYSQYDDLISRTEELYHRLRMEQDAFDIDPRWTDTAGAQLRSVLEELPPQSRSYVRRRLGSASLHALDLNAEMGASDYELRQVIKRELQNTADGAKPIDTLARFDAAKMSGPLADLYAEALLAEVRVDELLMETQHLIETQDAPRLVRAAVLNVAAGAFEGLGRLSEAADMFRTAVELTKDLNEEVDDDRVHIALAAQIGALRTARKQDEIRHFAGFARTRARQTSNALELVKRAYTGMPLGPVETREAVAELFQPNAVASSQPELFRMLAYLIESGEAFPGAINNPKRVTEIAGHFGFMAESPRELAGQLSKIIYGSEVVKVLEVIRDEVDWTLERAVTRPK